MNATLCDKIVPHLPHLRAFGRMLARDRTLADDLVQETVLRALVHAHQFRPDTNLKAWLTTILRNCYFDERRNRKRFARFAEEMAPPPTATSGDQEAHLELVEFERVFANLPALQREALTLVGASGLSYKEAADIAGCAIGTIKSRISRAREQMLEDLDDTGAGDRRFDDDVPEIVPTREGGRNLPVRVTAAVLQTQTS